MKGHFSPRLSLARKYDCDGISREMAPIERQMLKGLSRRHSEATGIVPGGRGASGPVAPRGPAHAPVNE